jgi:hypothetical protein
MSGAARMRDSLPEVSIRYTATLLECVKYMRPWSSKVTSLGPFYCEHLYLSLAQVGACDPGVIAAFASYESVQGINYQAESACCALDRWKAPRRYFAS